MAASPPRQSARERLEAAMVALVGVQGYAETTVAHVIKHAGASRRTFYAHFSDREECLLASSQKVLAGWVAQAQEAVERAQADEAGQPVGAFVDALLGAAHANPGALRMLTVELPGMGPNGVEQREELMAGLGAALRSALDGRLEPADGLDGDARSLATQALVGALMRVVYARTLRGRRVRRPHRKNLLLLAPDLTRWVTSYQASPVPVASHPHDDLALFGGRAPGTLVLHAQASEQLERLHREGSPSHSLVVHSQRERLLDALATLSAGRSYQQVTIPEIVREAGVSVQTFYEHFEGREDMLVVAYEVGRRKMLALIEHAYRDHDDWQAAAHSAIATLLAFLVSEPSFAHLALVDVPAAGGRLAPFAYDGPLTLARLLQPEPALAQSNGGGDGGSALVAEASTAAVYELCHAHLAARKQGTLLALVDVASYLARAPFPGAAQPAGPGGS